MFTLGIDPSSANPRDHREALNILSIVEKHFDTVLLEREAPRFRDAVVAQVADVRLLRRHHERVLAAMAG